MKNFIKNLLLILFVLFAGFLSAGEENISCNAKSAAIGTLLTENGTKEERLRNIAAAKVIAGNDPEFLIPCYAAQVRLEGYQNIRAVLDQMYKDMPADEKLIRRWHELTPVFFRRLLDQMTLEDDPAEFLKYLQSRAELSSSTAQIARYNYWTAEIIWRFSRADGKPAETDALQVVRQLENHRMFLPSGTDRVSRDLSVQHYTLLAKAHLQLNNFESVQHCLDAIGTMNGDGSVQTVYYELAGDLAMAQKKYPQAYIAYEKAGDSCLLKQAESAMICNKFEHALACLKKLKGKNPAVLMLDNWIKNLEHLNKTAVR